MCLPPCIFAEDLLQYKVQILLCWCVGGYAAVPGSACFRRGIFVSEIKDTFFFILDFIEQTF